LRYNLPLIPKGWVIVLRVPGKAHAQVVAGALRAREIPVILDYEGFGATFGLTVDGLGEVRIAVPAENEAQAQAVIREAQQNEIL